MLVLLALLSSAAFQMPQQGKIRLTDLPSSPVSEVRRLEELKGAERQRARRDLARLAACSLDRRPGVILRYLAGPVDGGPDGLKLHNFIDSTCFTGKPLHMSQEMLRGAAFTDLVRRSAEGRPLGAPMPIASTAADPAQPMSPAEKDYRKRLALGRCVADRARPLAMRFVVAEEGRRREDEALAAIRPLVPPCVMDGQGAPDPALLKGILAEALYRTPDQPRPTADTAMQGA